MGGWLRSYCSSKANLSYAGFNDLLIVYSRVFSVISIIFPGYFVGVRRVLQGCLKGISREFEST